MSISPAGYILIPIGLILFSGSHKNLLWATVISIILWNSSVVYIDPITFYLRTPLFFMCLLIIRNIFDALVSGKFEANKGKANFLLVSFLIFAGLSLVMPLIINGGINTYPISQEFFPIHPKKPLYFKLINITQYAYLLFAVLCFFVFCAELKTKERIIKVVNLSILLGVIVAISGITYQILVLINFNSAALNFYSFLGAPALSFEGKLLFGKIPRMYSLVGEPGSTALFLLFSFGLASTPLFWDEIPSRSRKKNGLASSIILLGLLLSTSTTAYVGIVIFLISFNFIFMIKFKPVIYVKAIFRISLLGLVFFTMSFIVFKFLFDYPWCDFFMKSQVKKLMLEHGSGATRWHYIIENLNLFLKYPLLGVGIGGSRSTAMLPALLSNIGLFGTLSFLLFNWFIFKNVFETYLKSSRKDIFITGSLLITFLTIFSLRLFARSISGLLFCEYWLLMAIMYNVYLLYRKNIYENRC